MTNDQTRTKTQLLAELQQLRKRVTALKASATRGQLKKRPPLPEKTNYGVLAEAANDFIFVIDRDDRVAYVNRYAAQQVGRPPEAIVGQPRETL
ncbi:MAG: PAS domain-containing protein, partial [Deltaproteobacteria bacterium]|nr:PAS domain-containing protein [Deltaproteobacteria bacterium]